ncbi:otoferlin-like isoform X4 [Clavelina lepadiformis]|uniref:otoferlin-like isoform X4 n=1 Tax=Clavelina lepadiformis TaxID=159417 RepID=UPI00404329B2
MSLQVTILSVTGLKGKNARSATITFRNHSYRTKSEECGNEAIFNETFEWPLASNIEESDSLTIDVSNYNKVFSNRWIGRFQMVLQQVVKNGELSLTEPLLDMNNVALKECISIEIKYLAPDGTVGNWCVEDFAPAKPLDSFSFNSAVTVGSKESSVFKVSINSDSSETSLLQPLLAKDPDAESGSKRKGFLGAVGLRSKQRPIDSAGDLVISNSGAIDSEPTREPRLLIGRSNPDLDAMSVVSMTMVDQPVTNKRSKPETRFESGAAKPQHFQVSITVIEARQLSGTNMDPIVVVQVGDDKKQTNQKESTNCPYYNEVFVFDYHVPKEVLFDKILTLKVMQSRNFLRTGKLVGKFKIDLATIYANTDHNFYHKWAVLTDPDDLNTGPKGYLKVDVSVVGKGDSIKVPKAGDDNADDIESNLFLPEGVLAERQRARYVFKIYQAEGLPKMNTSITEKLKTVLQGEARDLVDPYVEISFCDMKGRTSVRKNCYEPCWNEQITFTELFPPLCKRIKIQIRDKDNLNNTVIGTTFIELEKISNSGDRGFLPTFGPTYVNMYGSPRNYTMVNEHSDLNGGLGEGVAFRARLLMGFSVDLVNINASEGQGSSDVEVETITPLSELGAGKIEEFFLFGSILDANMISKTMSDKPITFEVTVGNYGNDIDGANFSKKTRQEDGGDSDNSLDDSDDDERNVLLKGSNQNFENPNIRSLTPSATPKTSDNYYYHMPYFEEKPCVYLTSYWHDQKRRLYNSNIMHKIADKLVEGIEDVQEMIKTDEERPDRRLRGVAEEFINGCVTFTRLVKGTGERGMGRTRLDKQRDKLCLREVEWMRNEANKIKKKLKQTTLKEKFAKMKSLLAKLKWLCDDPQQSIPDVFIWMLSGQKRVAYSRMPARVILHSVRQEESGIHCGKIQTIFLRLPGKRSLGPSGWNIQAKLDVYLWFGLAKNKRDFLRGLPQGYEVTRATKALNSPPMYLTYKDRQQFELRAHMYQARNLLAADESGLSDPFAKVIFSIHTDTTQLIEETLNPTWDQTLIIPNLTLFGRAEELRDDPPIIIIEVFDKDVVGKDEYIGRTIAKPTVKMSNERYESPKFPPKLDWYQIYRGVTKAGEILASFELLQIPYDQREMDDLLLTKWRETKRQSKNNIFEIKVAVDHEESAKVTESILTDQGPKYTVPKGIRPLLAKHRIEVLFWGLRDLKRVQLISVDRPRVDVEIAGRSVSSCVISNYKKNPNFAEPVRFIEDVDLPEVEYWCPPISITVVDCRAFGRSVLVGTHIISNISKFMFRPADKSKTYTAACRLLSQGLAGIREQQHRAAYAAAIAAKEDTVLTVDPVQTQQPNGAAGAVKIEIQEEDKRINEEEEDPLDETTLDWWSKYFASLETLNEEKQKQDDEAQQQQDLFSEEEKSGATSGDEKQFNNKTKSMESAATLTYFGQTITKKHETKDNKVTKKLLRGAVGAVRQAKKSLATPAKRKKQNKLPIDELKIYDNELENASDFSGFNDLLHSFNLYRGKRDDHADDITDQKRIVGMFKGAFKIYRYPLPHYIEQPDPQYGMFKGLPSNEPIHVLVRVYVIRATDLHPTDPNGKADPYVVISLGNNKVNDKENYISKQLNPTFGKTFDFEATFPMESILTVQIFDWDLLSADDLIGETKIDLENRFYSKHRSLCGIAEKYAIFGYNQWRDPMKPSQILQKLCKDHKLEGPNFMPGRVKVGTKTFTGPVELEDENGHKKPTDEHVALVALRHWDEIPKVGCKLVPEHVETRSLFSSDKPGIEQGRVELWVDMFPMDMPLPGPPVDVSPRKPKNFQLRVIIWNTDDVLLQDDDFFTGEKASDIYVKGWLLGDDKQETDIHYRSLTGEGNFNWRFIYPFDYLVAEEKIVVSKKESIFSWDESEFKIPPRLNLQVWDADHFSADDFLGSLTLDLTRMPRGAKSANKCTLNLAADDENADVPMVSLFKQRRIKGWWPFTAKNDQDELEITGKVEAEISLLTAEDAEKNPAGYGRDEPDPLEKPNRPDTSFVWFMNPLKSLRYLICTRFKWLIIKILVLLLLIALIVLFIYSSPSWLMKKILGA